MRLKALFCKEGGRRLVRLTGVLESDDVCHGRKHPPPAGGTLFTKEGKELILAGSPLFH